MTEKFDKHVKKLLSAERGSAVYLKEGVIGVTDGHRLLVMPEGCFPEDVPPAGKESTVLAKLLDFDADPGLNYCLAETFTLKAVREGIKSAGGAKAPVRWSPDGDTTLDARYMLEAMESLPARAVYVPNDTKHPAIFYASDDPTSEVKEYIMPCYNSPRTTGYFRAE